MASGAGPVHPIDPQVRHDLRTGVNQVLGYAELLEEECADAGFTQAQPTLEKIVRAAREQLERINRLGAGTGSAAAGTGALPDKTDRTDRSDRSDRTCGVSPDAQPARATSPHPTEHAVLVVDDNELNRDMLSRRLRARGYKVEVAPDGPQALAMVAAQPVDLLLLDVMMPGMSGLEVLSRVRAQRSSSDLPVIMVTAKDASEDVIEALEKGANDYVTKPLDFPVVLARVRTQLALKAQADEIRLLANDLDLRNRFIRQTFGRFLSDEVVRSLLESPEGLKLGGESRKVTILMSDLRGFTALCERFSPAQVVQVLNRHLGAMAELILAHQGTIDEFIGDAILAIFGAPIPREDDARRALACAASMQRAMAEVNRLNAEEGLPRLEMGIAVHTGEVVVGNIGSEKRMKYGIVGPPVNLTGRLESCTVGGQVLVSEATAKAVGDQAVWGERIEFQAKGVREPVVAFDLRGLAGEPLLPRAHQNLELVVLRRALQVRVVILDGKKLSSRSFTAELTALAPGVARLQSASTLRMPTDLCLSFDGESDSEQAYAKVIDGGTAEGYLLQFTALPEELARRLEEAKVGATQAAAGDRHG